MHITERRAGDLAELKRLAGIQRDAEQRDRLRAAALAIQGVPTLEIQRLLDRSRGFVQRWAYAYRDAGIDALHEKPRGGSTARINGENLARLAARLDAGPTPEDKVCTLRGRDVQRIAREELGVKVSLSAVYRTLHAMGYSCLAPRPRHEKHDPEAQRRFKEHSAPLL